MGEVPKPVVHLANFPLPEHRGDFGSGAVDRMGSGHVLLVLFEYGPESVGQALFQRQGLPTRLRPDDVQPLGAAADGPRPGRLPGLLHRRPTSVLPLCGARSPARGDHASCPWPTAPCQRPGSLPNERAPMSLNLLHRGAPRAVDTMGPAAEPLVHDGVHRDPSIEDPNTSETFSERVVRLASSMLARGQSRRSFLTKTAVMGSALAVSPARLHPAARHGVRLRCADLRRRLDRVLLHDQRRPQLLPVREASSPAGGRPTTPRTAAARPGTSSTATPAARRRAGAGARAPRATAGAPAATSSATGSVTRRSAATARWCAGSPRARRRGSTTRRAPRRAPPTTPRSTTGRPASPPTAGRHLLLRPPSDRQRVRVARGRPRVPRPGGPVARGRCSDNRGRYADLPRRTHLLDALHRRPRGARSDPVDVVPVTADVFGRLGYPAVRHEVVGRQPQPLLQLRAGPHLPVESQAPSRSTGRSTSSTRRCTAYTATWATPTSDVKTSSDSRSRYANFETGPHLPARPGISPRSTGRSSSSTNRCAGCTATSAIPRVT